MRMFLNEILDFNLRCMGKLQIVVEGNSMRPILKPGDTIEISKKKIYKIGDIVVFKEKDNRIVHRIIAYDQEHLITKGDNVCYSDLPIMYEDIMGKVSSVDKGGKKYGTELFETYNLFAETISKWENQKTIHHKEAYRLGKKKGYLSDKLRHILIQLLLRLIYLKEMWCKQKHERGTGIFM